MMQWLAERFAPGPLFAWACVAFAALIPVLWVRWLRRRARPVIRFSSLVPIGGLGRTWATRTRWVPMAVRTAAIVALMIAVARPQSGGEYHSTSEGIAIQMVMDISGSMKETDFVVNGRAVRRIDAVKKVFKDFLLGTGTLQGREGDLIGMTTFAMYADTVCPLTLDHGSLADIVDDTDIPGWVRGVQVREGEVEGNYTGIGDAIALATDDLRRAGEQAVAGVPGAEAAKSRVMILLTDGADNPAPLPGAKPPLPVEAAKVAATLGIRIYTIGAQGERPQRRELFMPLLQFDPRAEQTLKDVAAATGGKYFRATDTDSLATIYDEIDRLEQRRTGERTYQDNVFASKVAMSVALGLLLGESLLVNTRWRGIP
jgi:Ca-activated chloride channel family protein